MTERIQLHYIELAANSCAPAWGTQMGPPISNLTDGRYDLFYVPEHQVVLATLKVNTSTAPVQTVAYPCSNVRSMCFSTVEPTELEAPVESTDDAKRLTQSARMKQWHADKKAKANAG